MKELIKQLAESRNKTNELLEKIENYNPSELTLCEFLKIKDAEVFVPTTTVINGGINGDLPVFYNKE